MVRSRTSMASVECEDSFFRSNAVDCFRAQARDAAEGNGEGFAEVATPFGGRVEESRSTTEPRLATLRYSSVRRGRCSWNTIWHSHPSQRVM